MKMLRSRKYLVLDTETKKTFSEFRNDYQVEPTEALDKTKLLLLVQQVDDPSQQLYVFFPEDERPDVKTLTLMFELMHEKGVSNAIIVVEKELSPFARKSLAGISEFKVEVFREDELLIDITEHELVPKHEVLSRGEKAQLLERYTLKDSQLPRMYVTDPITRYFGLRRGDVVKIIRSSETAGRYVTYRIVY